jgi:FERM/RhoGEF/pleckstrin domain protein 2
MMISFFIASSENLDHSIVGILEEENVNSIERSCIQHRANTTMHVCWHRNLSVSMNDHRQSIKNQLSGYLLRKFKNSNGWQKLWVVFTNFCLFFYKTYQVKIKGFDSYENLILFLFRMIIH